MPKISVIVPVYNAAEYIERCAISLFEQTLDSIEYIFINDCTLDTSIEILKSVINKYKTRLDKENKFVRIENMSTNSGSAAVRKYGMLLATGDYIIHCDSDDWVDYNLYEEMYKEAIKMDADLVLCPICDEFMDYSRMRHLPKLSTSCQEIIENWYQASVGMFTWNKLVRRKVYIDNNILPIDGINMWEDNCLMIRIFYYSKRLSQIEGAVYHYNQANSKAMTSGYGRNSINQMICCAKELENFFNSTPDAIRFDKTVKTIKFLAKLNLVTYRFDWLKEFYKLFPESNDAIKWIKMDTFSSKGKIRFLFVKYHLSWLFVLLFKFRHIFSKFFQ